MATAAPLASSQSHFSKKRAKLLSLRNKFLIAKRNDNRRMEDNQGNMSQRVCGLLQINATEEPAQQARQTKDERLETHGQWN
jgi:hypothetical protein